MRRDSSYAKNNLLREKHFRARLFPFPHVKGLGLRLARIVRDARARLALLMSGIRRL